MALATLPYKFRISSGSKVGSNTDVTLVFDILDGNNAVLVSSAQVDIDPNAPFDEIMDTIRSVVFKQMQSDAGTKAQFLTAMIGKIVTVQ